MILNPVNNPRLQAHIQLVTNELQRCQTTDGFTINIKNTATTKKTVSLFDFSGACGTGTDQANTDGYVTCDYKGNIAGLRKYVAFHNISINEIQYQPASIAQFKEKLKYFIGEVNGDVIPKSLQFAVVKAQNSNQANTDVQVIKTKILLSDDMDLTLDVLPGEELSLSFSILEIERSL